MKGWASVSELTSRSSGWTRQRVLDACDLLDALDEHADAAAEEQRRR